jgi:TPR repeat protein
MVAGWRARARRMRRLCFLGRGFAAAAVLLGPGFSVADASTTNQVKLALVIGAGAYPFRPLTNPPGDAALIAEKLKTVDAFNQVIVLDDQKGVPVTRAAINGAVATLEREAENDSSAGKDVTIFFYFAGHGVEIDGESRLVPTSATDLLNPHPNPAHLEDETVSAQAVLDELVASGAARVLIVLDACRDNPWPAFQQGDQPIVADASGAAAEQRGLAATRGLGLVPLKLDSDVDTMIMFAAAARQTADDDQTGTGHSPFANALAVNLGVRGLSVREMFENVRSEVYAATGHRQKPDLNGVFEFALYPAGADGADHTTGDDFLRSVLKNGRKIEEIKSLAEKGDPFSEWMFSIANLKGIATPKDEAAAAKWVRKAVGDGLIRATVTMGFLYHHGQGVALDHVEGQAWDRVGADRGVAVAMNNLGEDYRRGWGVGKDPAAAAHWFRMAADKGLFLAQINLGNAYADGEGVPKDYTAALGWYEKAADAGDLAAMEAIGDLYATGEPDIANPEKALLAYRRAADAGDPAADRKIADIYRFGKGVPPDPLQAAAWRRRAFERSRQLADAGDVESQKLVAESYESGLNGLRIDHQKALEFYRAAAAQGDAEAKSWIVEHDR